MGLCIGFSFSDFSSLLLKCVEKRYLKGNANKISLVNQDQAHSSALFHTKEEALTPQGPVDPRVLILMTKLQCQVDKMEAELSDMKASSRN